MAVVVQATTVRPAMVFLTRSTCRHGSSGKQEAVLIKSFNEAGEMGNCFFFYFTTFPSRKVRKSHDDGKYSTTYLGDGAAVPTPVSSPRVVASLLPFCASTPITPSGARAAARARGQAAGPTLSAANTGDGSRQNTSTMDGARSALLPVASGFRLSATQARGGRSVMSRGGR